ncbi:MAG: nucleotidyltransferase domain-containing protein [Candidatus Heimdallarchaeota archaeon]
MADATIQPQRRRSSLQKILSVFEGFSIIRIAYLFGSAMEGLSSRQPSDVDIAVLLSHSKPNLETILEINDRLTAILKSPIDLVILNDCSIRTRFEVIKTGQLVHCKDAGERIDFEQVTMAQYYDRRYYDLRATREQIQGWKRNGFQKRES